MKTKQYIKELKHNLKTLNKNDKDEILKEIQSYIDESKCTYEELCSKFGNADALANSYLNNENKTIEIKKLTLSDKLLMFMGLVLIVMVIVVGYFFYVFTNDEFDYSKYDEKTVVQKVDEQWISVDKLEKINLNQSKVIVYWSNKNETKYTCQGDNVSYTNNILSLKQKYCYVILPKKQLDMKVYQSTLILIEPKASINLNLEQAQVRMFENKKHYIYDFDKKESKISDLKSQKSSIRLHGKLLNSRIEVYEY